METMSKLLSKTIPSSVKKSSKMMTYNRISSSFHSRQDLWSEGRVVKSPCQDIVIPKLTLDEFIWRNLDKWPTKVAAVCGITNRSYKYEELYKQSRILAANLRKKFGIDNGDTVAIMMRNAPEFATVVLGILGAGGVVTTFNPVYTCYEIQRLLQLSEIKVIIADVEVIATIKEALLLAKLSIPIITVDVENGLQKGTVSYKELLDDKHIDLGVLKDVKNKLDDTALMLHSSGTTGLPKCVEISNFNFVANCEQQNTELKQYSFTTETNQDRSLAILPLFHSYGLSIVLLHKLAAGLKIVTLPKFQPQSFLDALLKYEINLLFAAPPLVLFMGSHPQITPKHLHHLTTVSCGAAPLPPADIQQFLDRAPKDLQFSQAYGMTEASPLVSVSAPGEKYYDTAGYALPNIELRIVDGDLNNLGPNEEGEILIKGPNIMKGYKNNPQANKEVLLEGGWYRTGDMGKIDSHGLIKISDRIKELIKVNAFQVPPAELEYVLKEHPAVLDAAVVGVPDSITGEKPKAFVVLKEGVKTTDNDIISFVSERVARYKRIKEVSFVNSIPKNPSGKILRKELKNKFC